MVCAGVFSFYYICKLLEYTEIVLVYENHLQLLRLIRWVIKIKILLTKNERKTKERANFAKRSLSTLAAIFKIYELHNSEYSKIILSFDIRNAPAKASFFGCA